MAKKRVMVAGYEHGLPVDENGRILDPLSHDPAEDDDAEVFTDPLEEMRWVFGSRDDYAALDYGVLPDGRIVLHAEFSDEHKEEIYSLEDRKVAVEKAHSLIEEIMRKLPPGTVHDSEAWNQDETWFPRCVLAIIDGNGHADRFEE